MDWKRIILLCIGVLVVFFLLGFLFVNIRASARYERSWEICLTYQERTLEDNEDLANQASACRESGGCFIACGSACRPDPKPQVTMGEYIAGLIPFRSQYACAAVCVSRCMPPPDQV